MLDGPPTGSSGLLVVLDFNTRLSPRRTFRFKLGNPPLRLAKPTFLGSTRFLKGFPGGENIARSYRSHLGIPLVALGRTEDLASDWHSGNGL